MPTLCESDHLPLDFEKTKQLRSVCEKYNRDPNAAMATDILYSLLPSDLSKASINATIGNLLIYFFVVPEMFVN